MAFELRRRTPGQVPRPVAGASALFLGTDGNAKTKRDDGSVESHGPAAWVPKWKDSIAGNFFVNGETVSVNFGEVAMFSGTDDIWEVTEDPPPTAPAGLGGVFGYVRLPPITPESAGQFAGGLGEMGKFGLAQGLQGSITNTGVGGAELNDGETVTLEDGVHPAITYEFDENGGGVTPGNIPVVYTPADDPETIRIALGTEINDQSFLGNSEIVPLDGGPGVIDLQVSPPDIVSAVPSPSTETVADPNFIVEGMALVDATITMLIVLPEPGDSLMGLPAGVPTPPHPLLGIAGDVLVGPAVFWSDGVGTWYHFNGLTATAAVVP